MFSQTNELSGQVIDIQTDLPIIEANIFLAQSNIGTISDSKGMFKIFYTSKNLNKIWHDAGKKVGIKIKMYNGTRHSLGSQLLDMGCDLSLVQDQLGHTKPEMTRRYAKRSPKSLADALEARRGKIIDFENARR